MIKSIIIRRPIIMARREKQPVHKVVMTEGKRHDHQPDIRHADGYLILSGRTKWSASLPPMSSLALRRKGK